MKFSYAYARPEVTVDIVIFGYDHESADLSLLLIERNRQPFLGEWALPGGFIHMDETLEEAARRELREEAGVKDVYLEQLYTFGALKRDPRDRVISVAYYALVERKRLVLKAGTDAACAKWFPVAKPPRLAFDHKEIVKIAVQRLRGKIRYEPIGFELLPQQFTLTQLQMLYEVILDQPLDKRNFRKKILSFGVLKPAKKKLADVPYRAPQLFSFDEGTYKSLLKSGTKYEI